MIDLYVKTKEGWSTHSFLEIFTFPGGEPHVRIKEGGYPFKAEAHIAVVRQPTMADLITLPLLREFIREELGENFYLALPYVPFARADRGAPGGALFVGEYITEFVLPDKLVILDPHSNVVCQNLWTESGDNPTLLPLPKIVHEATLHQEYVGIIAPDKGAHDRAKAVADYMHLPVYQAGKTRDFKTGALSGFECEELPKEGTLLLVDDICDGGGTFIGLADTLLKTQNVEPHRLDLWVSHGIFSKGLSGLTQKFGTVYTTDSWASTTLPQSNSFKRVNLTPYIFGALND